MLCNLPKTIDFHIPHGAIVGLEGIIITIGAHPQDHMFDIVLRGQHDSLTGRADCLPAVLGLGMGKGAVDKVGSIPAQIEGSHG